MYVRFTQTIVAVLLENIWMLVLVFQMATIRGNLIDGNAHDLLIQLLPILIKPNIFFWMSDSRIKRALILNIAEFIEIASQFTGLSYNIF